MDDESALLYAQAVLGKDAEQFMASELGRTMLGIAQQEADAAMLELKRVYPWRRRRIGDLQAVIRRAESFETWLRELFVRGQQAVAILEDEE
jgi:hypothetical protein